MTLKEKVIAREVLVVVCSFVKTKDGICLSLDRFKGCKGGCKLASREEWVADGREETTEGYRRGKLKDRIGILEVRVSLVLRKDSFASETGGGKIKTVL